MSRRSMIGLVISQNWVAQWLLLLMQKRLSNMQETSKHTISQLTKRKAIMGDHYSQASRYLVGHIAKISEMY